MPCSFDYAVIRVVPRVERQEFINAGIVLFCLERRWLKAKVRMDEGRLRALWPEVDVEVVRAHLEAVKRVCAGDREGGPIARLSIKERFHWVVAARSTVIQTSPVHTGVCDLEEDLEGVLARLVEQFL